MRIIDGEIRLSASDLMRFKGCRHATTLDLRHMEIGDLEPAADGDEAELLQKQGDDHELAFLGTLKAKGRSIADIPKDGSLEASVEATRRAMAEGPDVIFQGAFLGGAWGGYSDFLERVDKPSALGDWSYEVVDTKLKRSPDPTTRTVTLRRTLARGALPDQLDLIPPKPLQNNTLRNAIAAVIDDLIAGGAGSRAAEALLTRSPPDFATGPRPGGVIDPAGDLPAQTSAAILDLEHSTLAIQGPPGTGKTYVSALSIVDLVRAGRRVAVSSNSHKAITNLLAAVADRARAEGVPCDIVQKTSDDGEGDIHPDITLVEDNDAPEIGAADVVGATAWHFARYDAAAYDHLIVDEAGQVSLANILAMSRAARNLVLVGDPMQLPQPLQGAHPGRSGESCLEYLIDGHRVVAAERGVFIPISRRMHPGVCDYISRTVYEGRLESDAGASGQTLLGPGGVDLTGAGLRPVIHAGRSQVSPEEVAAIRDAIDDLIGTPYRDRNGAERALGLADILVVAPYNAQVNALRAALPAAVRVGTVDRFQGQEAPVCLVSMTTSSGDEMPRDIGFLFSLNRINVAVSRAQARAVVFASPRLLETPCRTVEDMIRVNAVCALREHGGDRF